MVVRLGHAGLATFPGGDVVSDGKLLHSTAARFYVFLLRPCTYAVSSNLAFLSFLYAVSHLVVYGGYTLIGLTLILVILHLAQLPGQLCLSPTSPGLVGQKVDQSISKSTKPSPRPDGTPCTLRSIFVYQRG